MLIDRDVDPEEINMAVRSEERDQDDKQSAREGGLSGAIEQGKRIRLTRSKIPSYLDISVAATHPYRISIVHQYQAANDASASSGGQGGNPETLQDSQVI